MKTNENNQINLNVKVEFDDVTLNTIKAFIELFSNPVPNKQEEKIEDTDKTTVEIKKPDKTQETKEEEQVPSISLAEIQKSVKTACSINRDFKEDFKRFLNEHNCNAVSELDPKYYNELWLLSDSLVEGKEINW